MPRKKLFIWFFKIAVIIVSYGFIAYRIFFDEALRAVLVEGEMTTAPALFFLLCLVLMPVNWALETAKWKLLLHPTERVGFLKAYGSVLSGLSIAIFTPNRIGEYAGRIWILRQRNRLAGVSLTIAGSIAQSGVTFFAGVLSGWYWLSLADIVQLTTPPQVLLATGALILGGLFYYFLPELASWLLNFKLRKYIDQFLTAMAQLKHRTLLAALLISMARYAIFVAQFVFLLVYFESGLTLMQSLMCIGLLYAGMLIVPTVIVAEPGVRGSLTLLIFGVFSSNDAGILAASLTLWLINLAVPALFGAAYLATLKIDQS